MLQVDNPTIDEQLHLTVARDNNSKGYIIYVNEDEAIHHRTDQAQDIIKGCVDTLRAYLNAHQELGWEKPYENYGTYYVSSRGIGLDHTPGCYICGGGTALYNNISCFVDSKAAGEAIVSMFKTGVRLDWREREPNWIQVKIGACDEHLPNLTYLDLVLHARHSIDQKLADYIMKWKVVAA